MTCSYGFFNFLEFSVLWIIALHLAKKDLLADGDFFAVTQQFLNSARMTEAGPLETLSGEESDDERELRAIKLTGVRKGGEEK